MDLDGENPELRAFASYCAGQGGAFWVAERDGIMGTVAAVPAPDAWEIKRLYVAQAERGTGLAQALLGVAGAYAAGRGAARLELWSDTRFARAHRFYEKMGYARFGEARALGDASRSVEFGYAKGVSPASWAPGAAGWR